MVIIDVFLLVFYLYASLVFVLDLRTYTHVGAERSWHYCNNDIT